MINTMKLSIYPQKSMVSADNLKKKLSHPKWSGLNKLN